MHTTALAAVERVLNQRGSWVLVAQGSVSTNRGKQAHQRFIWDDQSGATDSETSPP